MRQIMPAFRCRVLEGEWGVGGESGVSEGECGVLRW